MLRACTAAACLGMVAAAAAEETLLTPEQALRVHPAAGGTTVSVVPLETDTFAHVELLQSGVDAAITLEDPDGQEGIVGLTRGFMYAGARGVMASLWPVDDRATARLMSAFYEGMLGPNRLDPPAALRQAQLAIMKDLRWSAPYYWAAFQLQGDWRTSPAKP